MRGFHEWIRLEPWFNTRICVLYIAHSVLASSGSFISNAATSRYRSESWLQPVAPNNTTQKALKPSTLRQTWSPTVSYLVPWHVPDIHQHVVKGLLAALWEAINAHRLHFVGSKPNTSSSVVSLPVHLSAAPLRQHGCYV